MTEQDNDPQDGDQADDAGEATVVEIETDRVDAVIDLDAIAHGIAREAEARAEAGSGPQVTDTQTRQRLERIRDLARQLSQELAQLPPNP